MKKQSIDPHYLIIELNKPYVEEQVQLLTKGDVIPRLSLDDFLSIMVYVPISNPLLLERKSVEQQKTNLNLLIMVTQEYFEELKESMAKKSVESLIREFNRQVGRRAWTSIRGLHDSVLIDTLIEKSIDVSAVYDGVTISFARKIKLNDDKTKVILV